MWNLLILIYASCEVRIITDLRAQKIELFQQV
jgi:hypothetical protein